jgi:hypothetical protein
MAPIAPIKKNKPLLDPFANINQAVQDVSNSQLPPASAPQAPTSPPPIQQGLQSTYLDPFANINQAVQDVSNSQLPPGFARQAPTSPPPIQQNLQSYLNFHPNGSVDYAVGGKTFNLTKDEYNAYLSTQTNNKSGLITPNVQNLINTEADARLRNQIENQFNKSKRVQDIINEMVNKNISSSNTNITSDIINNPIKTNEMNSQQLMNDPTMGGADKMIEGLTYPPQIQNKLQAGAQIIEAFDKYAPEILQIPLKKSVAVTKAEQAFTDNSNVLNTKIAMVKEGILNPNDVTADIEATISSINDLERQTHGLGRTNLRFWLDKGAEIEAQLARERTTLEAQRVQLIQAYQVAQVNQAKSSMGIQ